MPGPYYDVGMLADDCLSLVQEGNSATSWGGHEEQEEERRHGQEQQQVIVQRGEASLPVEVRERRVMRGGEVVQQRSA